VLTSTGDSFLGSRPAAAQELAFENAASEKVKRTGVVFMAGRFQRRHSGYACLSHPGEWLRRLFPSRRQSARHVIQRLCHFTSMRSA
jgi:hypothetical protein